MREQTVALAVLLALAVSACTAETEDTGGGTTQEELYLDRTWVERETRVRTLDRMFQEESQDNVVDNFSEKAERLYDMRVLIEVEDGTHTVEVDQDEWGNRAGDTNKLDAALREALIDNEVTWCAEPVDADDFVEDYTSEFTGMFETREGYYSSIEDYVDCGDGRI